MTNSQVAPPKIWLSKCSPHPPGSSQSNFLKYSQEHGCVFRISPPTSLKPTPKHSTSITDKHYFPEIDITPTATTTITLTTTTINSLTKIPALYEHQHQLSTQISHAIFTYIFNNDTAITLHPSSPGRCRNSNNQDSGRCPHYTSSSQKKSLSLGDFDTSPS